MTLQHRHTATDKTLNRAAQRIINGPSARQAIKPLAVKYGVTGQTILNYMYGMGKDGFLKEALINDLKNGVI